MGKIKDELLRKVYVRAYKKFPDGRISLCGEPVLKDAENREYFEIPAEFADNAISIGYDVTTEFIKEVKKENVVGNENKK